MKANTVKNIFLIMDYWEFNLRNILDADVQNYSHNHLYLIVYNLLCAINYLHSANVLHRDLKPSNILITQDCDVRICDFGLAQSMKKQALYKNKLSTETKTEMYQPAFSRWYRPPEAILMDGIDTKADMWSIGCVISEFALKLSNKDKVGKQNCVVFPGKACFPVSPCTSIKPKYKTIFSEIHKHDQILEILKVLGKQEGHTFDCLKPDGKKFMRNVNALSPELSSFDEKFKEVDTKMKELLRVLFQFNPKNRSSAYDCLASKMFADYRLESNEKQAKYTITTEIDSLNPPSTVKECIDILKQQIYKVKSSKLCKLLTT